MRLLIVDGYNVIRSTAAYEHLKSEEWESAREALIADVAAYAQNDFDHALIVFDGAANPHSEGASSRVAGIEVMFSRHGTSADSAIEARARQAREQGDEVVVVSSDATVQWTTMGSGVTRMSSRGFVEEHAFDEESRQERRVAGKNKNPLAERLSEEEKEKLEKLRRRL